MAALFRFVYMAKTADVTDRQIKKPLGDVPRNCCSNRAADKQTFMQTKSHTDTLLYDKCRV